MHPWTAGFSRPSELMPLAFPSHQGLILPLWRAYPARIDAVALCIGAAMPDVVDGIAGAFRGHLGQWLGHSLVGVLVAVPPGLALAALARRLLPAAWIVRLDEGADPRRGWLQASASVAIGALSHLLSDLVTHGGFPLLWPWYRNDRLFPSWWYHAWGHVPLPGYRDPYPIAPHTISWVVFSIVGAWLFVWCFSWKRRERFPFSVSKTKVAKPPQRPGDTSMGR